MQGDNNKLINPEINTEQIENKESTQNIKTCRCVYIKSIVKNSENQKHQETIKTLQKLQQIRHENLVRLQDFEQDDDGSIFVEMEICDYNLMSFSEKNNQYFQNIQYLIDFLRSIVNGYCRLIESQIIHRDLKPQNILCKEENNKIIFKIGGYGFSKIIDTHKSHNMSNLIGLSDYSAPELDEDEYTNRCDIYSLGLILKELMNGNNQSQLIQQQQILNSINQQNNTQYDEILKLVEDMLIKDPQKRISWSKLKLKLFYPEWNENGNLNNVQKVKNINGEFVCIKQIYKKINNRYENELNEIEITNKIKNGEKQNTNIIKIFEVLNEIDYDYAYIIMENCEGDLKDLREKQGLFDCNQILEFLLQVINGYLFLMENKIVHRDLKPHNILYLKTDSGICYKITDFQYSFDKNNQKKSVNSKTGTLMYQAPEVNGKENYDFSCDIYSLGMIVLELVMDIKDLKKQEVDEIKIQLQQNLSILDIISKAPFNYQISNVDNKIQSLIQQMIKFDQKGRIIWKNLYQQITLMKSYKASQNQSIQQQNLIQPTPQDQKYQNQQQIPTYPVQQPNITQYQNRTINQVQSNPQKQVVFPKLFNSQPISQQHQNIPPLKIQFHSNQINNSKAQTFDNLNNLNSIQLEPQQKHFTYPQNTNNSQINSNNQQDQSQSILPLSNFQYPLNQFQKQQQQQFNNNQIPQFNQFSSSNQKFPDLNKMPGYQKINFQPYRKQ